MDFLVRFSGEKKKNLRYQILRISVHCEPRWYTLTDEQTDTKKMIGAFRDLRESVYGYCPLFFFKKPELFNFKALLEYRPLVSIVCAECDPDVRVPKSWRRWGSGVWVQSVRQRTGGYICHRTRRCRLQWLSQTACIQEALQEDKVSDCQIRPEAQVVSKQLLCLVKHIKSWKWLWLGYKW